MRGVVGGRGRVGDTGWPFQSITGFIYGTINLSPVTATMQRRQVAMVNRRRVEKDVPSVGAKNGGCDDVSLTADGKLFHTVGAKMQKARAAVTVS